MKGFTTIEVLITLLLLAVLAMAGIPIITGYQTNVEVDNVAEAIVAQLRSAQSKSITGQDTNTWGVHFDTSVADEHFVAIFQGASYGAGTDIEPFHLLHGARLSNLSLNGAGNDVLFNRLYGTTSQYGTGAGNRAVCVTQANNSTACQKGIIITANGKISVQ